MSYQIEQDSEQITTAITEMCMIFHQNATGLSDQFFREQQRHFYVTPTSYLELLGTYRDLLTKKRNEIDSKRNRYSVSITRGHFRIRSLTSGWNYSSRSCYFRAEKLFTNLVGNCGYICRVD